MQETETRFTKVQYAVQSAHFELQHGKAKCAKSGKQRRRSRPHHSVSAAKVGHLMERHGMFGTRLYRIWTRMKQRCNCPQNPKYKDYGGRGISVCDEWNNSFIAFMEWANDNGYDDTLTIDRINYNRDYCPENCRWISNDEQQLNKRNNRLLEYNGEKHCIAEWSRITGLSYQTIYSRISNGWEVEEALSMPSGRMNAWYKRKTRITPLNRGCV